MSLSAEQALEHWQKKKLLTAKKAAELRASLDDNHDVPSRAIGIFSALGGILVGLGVILFIGSNWSEITPLFKTIILLVGMLVTGIPGYYLAYEKEGYERTGIALLFVNTLIFGASIFLIGQIYHLPLNFWMGMLFWFIGTATMAYILESKLHLWLAVPQFVFFLGWLKSDYLTGFDEAAFLFDERSAFLALFPILGILGVCLAVLHRKYKNIQFGESTLFHWGLFLATFAFVFVSVDKSVFFRYFHLSPDAVTIGISVVTLLVLIITTAIGSFKLPQGKYAPVVLALFTIFALVLSSTPQLYGFPTNDVGRWVSTSYLDAGMFNAIYILYVVLMFVYLLTMIWYATLLRLAGVINIGIGALGIAIMIQYFSWAFELFDRSLAFIIGGVLILVLSAVLERQRRKLLTTT